MRDRCISGRIYASRELTWQRRECGHQDMWEVFGEFTPFAWRERRGDVADARRCINAPGAPRFSSGSRVFSVAGARSHRSAGKWNRSFREEQWTRATNYAGTLFYNFTEFRETTRILQRFFETCKNSVPFFDFYKIPFAKQKISFPRDLPSKDSDESLYMWLWLDGNILRFRTYFFNMLANEWRSRRNRI